MDLPPVIVFFDSDCLLCDRSVRWLMDGDRDESLSFAPLGGETSLALQETGVLNEGHQGKQSMILAERTTETWVVLQRSDAVIRALELSGAAPLRLRLLKLLPRFLREVGYRLVAKTRILLFGKTDQCRLPDEDTAGRVLP